MQSVQDLSIDSRTSRTQYQYTLEDPDLEELQTWAPRVLQRLRDRAATVGFLAMLVAFASGFLVLATLRLRRTSLRTGLMS